MTQTASTPILHRKTPARVAREARDLALYEEFHQFAGDPEQSRTELVEYLMKKYDLHSSGTVYTILKRVEERKKPNKKPN